MCHLCIVNYTPRLRKNVNTQQTKKNNTMNDENTPMQQPADAASEAWLLAELAIDDAATAQMLDADVVAQIKDLCQSICRGEVSADAIAMLLAGINHDRDVSAAYGEGYLRGKNEKIATLHRFDSDAESIAQRHSVTPRFARRSIWDLE